jgi:thiamine-monophosphate kinase
LNRAETAFLVTRYRLPVPRVKVGPHLIGIATAGLDVSDGLVADLQHLCDVSGISAVIEAESVPLSSAARELIAIDRACLNTALTGGDDYEIVFTAAPAAVGRISELSRSTGVPITHIGRVSASSANEPPRLIVLDSTGKPLQFAATGWTHFGKPS